jgi:hypothetical protein
MVDRLGEGLRIGVIEVSTRTVLIEFMTAHDVNSVDFVVSSSCASCILGIVQVWR